MRKWQKAMLWGAASLALLLAAGYLALGSLADGSRLKAIAHDRVKQTWGRELQVESLAWSLFPSPRLHARGVTVSNAPWATDKHFMEISAVDARLALWPLLAGKAVVERLDVEGWRTNLEIAADGRRNWDLPEVGNDDSTAQRLPHTLQQLQLTAMRVSDGQVLFRQRGEPPSNWGIGKFKANADAHLRNVSLSAELERDGHALSVNGRFDDLSGIGKPQAHTEGRLALQAGDASAVIQGSLPLAPSSQDFDVRLAIDAPSLKETFGFFAVQHGLPAALKLDLHAKGTGEVITVDDASLQLGKMHTSGAGTWRRDKTTPSFTVELRADRFDMVQTPLDAGQPPLARKPEGELFYDNPLPWNLLRALDGRRGKAEVRIDALRLRSGVTVNDATAVAAMDDGRLSVTHFGGTLLGGTAQGDLVMHARDQSVHLNLHLHGTQLGQWFRQSGKKADIAGGALEVDASFDSRGNTMKELAAGISGPMNVRVGPTKIRSENAGRAEFWMNGLFSARDADEIDLNCASLRLPFRAGVARGSGIAGARSEASQLLTSGTVDMRRQEVDLHGKVRARSGINLGISTFTGDVKIVGRIAKPQLSLDQAGLGGALARIGAAIVTGGISIIATSIWDGANPASDPCQVVFSAKARNAPAAMKP